MYIRKRSSFLGRQNKAFIWLQCALFNPSKETGNREESDDTSARANLSRVVENGLANRAAKDSNVTKVRAVRKAKCQSTQGNQKFEARMRTPEQGILKAMLFIFITLFMSYLPFFFYMSYNLTAKNVNIKVLAICTIAMLFNSTLNTTMLSAKIYKRA